MSQIAEFEESCFALRIGEFYGDVIWQLHLSVCQHDPEVQIHITVADVSENQMQI